VPAADRPDQRGVPFDDLVPRIPVPCGRLRTLAAFATVTAKPGRAAEARLAIPARAFARYDEASGGWVRPARGVHRPHRQIFG
jgi:hypothetical protein